MPVLSSEVAVLLARLWRWKVYIILLVIAGGMAGLASTLDDQTTYTSRAALTVLSENRGPEQDAILSQGYAAFFNDDAYQAQLRKVAGVPDDVTFEATTGLASPLLYITATSTSRESVASSARAMATALTEQVNNAIDNTHQESINAARQEFESLGSSKPAPDQALVNLYDRISEIAADTSNKLRPVQLDSSITSSKPSELTPIALGAGAGLFVGILGAIVFGGLSRRIYSSADVEPLLDAPVLATFPCCRPNLMQSTLLWSKLRRIDPPLGSVLVVARARRDESVESVVEGLRGAARRTGTCVLISLNSIAPGDAPGLADYVSDPRLSVDAIVRHLTNDSCVIEYGTATGDGYSILTNPRAQQLVERLRDSFQTVIIDAPPLRDTAEGPAACMLADSVIVAVDQVQSRIDDLKEAATDLEALNCRIAGVVLVEQRGPKFEQDRHEDGAIDELGWWAEAGTNSAPQETVRSSGMRL